MSNLSKFKDFFGNDTNPLAGYTLHSGGAEGSDLAWETIGNYHRMNLKYNIKHYYVEGSFVKGGNIPITLKAAKKADPDLKKVNNILKRKFPTGKKYVDNLLRRNWLIAENSEAIFAIAEIKNNIVQGGTGWATHLAIMKNKPVYVFSQRKNLWFTLKYNKFVEYEDVPTLTKEFGGIGTRNITKNGLYAINSVYKKTIKDA